MGWRVEHTAETSLGHVKWGSTGNGPALILAHGWPWSSYSWSDVIPALAGSYTLFWYDMPGFGQSDPALDRPTDIGAQASVFAEMVAFWSLEEPAVWAHDFGGAVTLRARLLDGLPLGPQLFMNVVAMRPWGSAFFEHVGRHSDAFFGLPPHIHAAVARAYVQSALAHDLPYDHFEALVTPWLTETGQRAFYRQFAQADEALTAAFEPKLGDFPASCKVIWGADDPWIPIARGKALASALGCPFDEMPGAGHLPQLERPEAAFGQAKTFFAEAMH